MDSHKRDDVVLLAVAMDAEGIPAAKPLYDGAKAKYVTTVDAQNALGTAWGYSLVPNGFLIDEAGVLQYKKVGGMDVKRPASVAAVEEFLAKPPVAWNATTSSALSEPKLMAAIAENIDSGTGTAKEHRAYGLYLVRQAKYDKALGVLRTAAKMDPKSSQTQFGIGRALLGLGKKEAAVKSLQAALKLDPKNYIIRKQIWVIRFPEKFHPEIDWAWQRVQMKKELDAEKKDGK
jgi:tetratricopeptide (TPR) repeat protein